jgi:flavoprotein
MLLLLLLLLPQATSGSRQEVVLAAGDSLFGEASRIAVAGKLPHLCFLSCTMVHSIVAAVQLQWRNHCAMFVLCSNGCSGCSKFLPCAASEQLKLCHNSGRL